MKHVALEISEKALPCFAVLFRRGVELDASVGCSVEAVLCGQFGLSLDYLERRIQTLFLDGRPVDDVRATTVRSGSVIALSAAMPGLAGATLRRGGYFGSLRYQLAHPDERPPACTETARVTVKVFNLLGVELGGVFLKRGVHVGGKALAELFRTQEETLRAHCRKISLDGFSVTPEDLAAAVVGETEVHLQAESP